MKGIILAGGSGTRLYPSTLTISKQILPVYDKPMIYYPLSTLMLSGIKDILIISTPTDLPLFKNLLGDGTHFGIKLTYEEQAHPNGLAEAFIIGEKFIGTDPVCLILGDNIFYGQGLGEQLIQYSKNLSGGTVLGYYVNDPERYGVAVFDSDQNLIDIEEKPDQPKSNFAITGLYYYDNDVVEIAKNLSPSDRGELEITDVNKEYLKRNKLKLETLGRGVAWLDTGTHDSLLEAAQFVSIVENRQGLKISCPEEIAFRMNYINLAQLEINAIKMGKSTYGEYLLNLVRREKKQ
jgi:glucose-1-phosphate thymidylyltransferase